MADEDKAKASEEESAAVDAARAEADPSSVVEPSEDELTKQDAADEDFAADLRDEPADPEPADPEPSEPGEPETDGDRVPEPVGAASRTAATKKSAAPRGSAQVARKDRPTAKRDTAATKPHRTGPITFVKESVAELRKVVYPTAPQLGTYFVAVLVFVLFIIAIVGVLDLGFGSFMFWLFAGA